MKNQTIDIKVVKASGDIVDFSFSKLRKSLQSSGASNTTVEEIINTIKDEVYDGISTKEIHKRAYTMLNMKNESYGSRYKLKKAIYELGPTGFPFERFVSSLLDYSGFETSVNVIVKGYCVAHEVDVMAIKNHTANIVECKFHSDASRKCNVKVPLYINSRFKDIARNWQDKRAVLANGWVVTNTRFTKDAMDYGTCANLYLLSWNHPKGNSLKERIDRLGLYPITTLRLFNQYEKEWLLEKGVVLCRTLLDRKELLNELNIKEPRKGRLFQTIEKLCT
ncbi:ATP cone domain-containing protein [Spongiivirga sp. MCCC 1A20706]|uniref:ATP cone domain-containing protein n=1 Tax=Spongiivirga sp. MCCC 1A20706 TaxID=3160963 RepID=UPI0039773FEE